MKERQNCWDSELTQKRVQSWIECISRHIEKFIGLEWENGYWEGRNGGEFSCVRPYDSEERREWYQRVKMRVGGGDDRYVEVIDSFWNSSKDLRRYSSR